MKKNKMNFIKTTSTIALTLLLISCSSITKKSDVISLKLHQKIPKSATIKNNYHFMTTSGAMEQVYIFKENNNTFEVMTNKKGLITFIKSTDRQFTSPYGIKSGDSLEKVQRVSKKELKNMLGWGYYVSLSNGWFATISSDKKVDWLFKTDVTIIQKTKFP